MQLYALKSKDFDSLENNSQLNKGLSFINDNLNLEQKINIQNSLDDLNFPFTYLIHGPSGTGKTCTLVELIMQFLVKGKRILVASSSNAAVDNLAIRFIAKSKEHGFDYKKYNPLRMGTMMKVDSSLNFLKLNHLQDKRKKELENKIVKINLDVNALKMDSVQDNISYLAKDIEIEELQKELQNVVKDIVKKSKVTFCTLTSNVMEDILDDLKWDVLIIDEASQSKLSECLLSIKHCNKVIFAGDDKQLPPIFKTKESIEVELNEDFNKSLFELILIRQANKLSHPLKMQFRMNKWIMSFPSSYFYKNSLIAHNSIKENTIKDLSYLKGKLDSMYFKYPVMYYDTYNMPEFVESKKEETFSYYNDSEADLIATILSLYLKLGIKADSIGVITGYRAQVDCIYRKIVSNKEIKLSHDNHIEINTVDSFQGREKDIIIMSLVRTTYLGFYRDLKRINVALTRAKKQLIIIGNLSLFAKLHEFYLELYNNLKLNATLLAVK